MKKFGCLVFFLPTLVFCQPYIDLVKLESHIGGKADYDTGNFSTNYLEFTTDLLIPIVLDKWTLLTGINYERTLFQDPTQRNISLTNAFLKIGFNRYTQANKSWTLILLPRYASSARPGSVRVFQMGFIGFRKIERSNNENFRWGIYANQELFGPFLVPLVGWYKKTEKWEINCLLPLSAEVNYAFTSHYKSGFRFTGIVKSYAFSEYGDSRYAVKAHHELGLIHYLTVQKFIAFASVGSTVGRSVRLYDQGDKLPLAISALKIGDNREVMSIDFDDSFFIRLGLYYRFPSN